MRVRRTLSDLLDDAAERSPTREVVFPTERATWPAVREAARSWAAGLHARGVRRGDRVLIVLPGGLDAVVGTVAAAMLGAVPTPVNHRGTADEVAWLRDDADPTVVVASPSSSGSPAGAP
ncbi:AMP-binding protein [Actinomycetospora sp. CA-053990]|uniref:AMP-binding protein n=1 Tax=Actinomycetospora sp. CA-053990 TaxID=3239891 RepID=UPI003D934A23